jgi:hypothetical protein
VLNLWSKSHLLHYIQFIEVTKICSNSKRHRCSSFAEKLLMEFLRFQYLSEPVPWQSDRVQCQVDL